MISGPTATAKTGLIAEMVKLFLCALLILNYDGGTKILVCTPDNSAADEIAKQMHGSAHDNPLIKDAIIICIYSVKTEKKVVNIRLEANEDQVSNNFFLIAD